MPTQMGDDATAPHKWRYLPRFMRVLGWFQLAMHHNKVIITDVTAPILGCWQAARSRGAAARTPRWGYYSLGLAMVTRTVTRGVGRPCLYPA